MNNELRICVVGIGEQGINAVEFIKHQTTLPLSYAEASAVDCIVVLSAFENASDVKEIIDTINKVNGEAVLGLTIAVKPKVADEYIRRIDKIKGHCCVIMAGHDHAGEQHKFALQTIDNLFGPFFQHQLIGLDFCELQSLLVPDTIAVAVYITVECDKIKQNEYNLVKNLNERRVIINSNTEFFINVVQHHHDLDVFDVVTELLFDQLFTHEYWVCNTIDPRLDNEIGIFLLATNQEL